MSNEIELPLSRLPQDRPPVVLMGGVNLVRTLGLAGIPAIIATSDRHEPALASRYCLGRCTLPPMDQPAAVVDALVALGDRLAGAFGRRIPLMYGSDDALELLNAHRERLQRYFLYMTSEEEVGDALIAKDRFQMFATRRELPVPRALRWNSEGPDNVAAATGPVLVKPSVKVDWHHSALCHRLFDGEGKARVFPNGAAAAAHAVVAEFAEQLTFQEYIPGSDRDLWSFHGFADEKGDVLASFVGRKVRTYPVDNGESAFIELADEPSLEAVGRDVARRCPLKGVFKMDFKRDARTGRWYLLEINGRYNLWNYLGAVNGLNLMRVAYEYMTMGRRPEPQRAGTRLRWLALNLDFLAFRELARRGDLSWTGWVRSIVLSHNVYNLFSWRDPLPCIEFWVSRIGRRWHRVPHKFMGALRQWRSTAS